MPPSTGRSSTRWPTSRHCRCPYNAAYGFYLERPAPVGSYKANAFGLFDMHGNVWQWCQDGMREYKSVYAEDPVGPDSAVRVLRGGSWFNDARFSRAAFRIGLDPGFRDFNVGFRVALAAPPPTVP